MKKPVVIFGLIFSILGVIISVTPLQNLAIIPIIIALVCVTILFYIKKKTGVGTKFIQYIIILSAISLSLTIYKTVFSSNNVENIEGLEQKEDESVEDSIELLEDIEIDE